MLVGAGLLYLALAIGMFATIWFEHGGPASRALGVGGDQQLAIWFLRWQAFAITSGHNLLYATYLDAPGGVNLMWNTTAPVLGVLLAALTLTLGVRIGAAHRNKPVVMFVAGAEVRVVTEEGELLRALTIDPTRDYQPPNGRWPVHNVLRQASGMS
ncbi:MAG: hypothetical protein QOH92_897 [Chloroflexota bacterium]|nr:hypothetical protein [Chloroflexota bacterium]